MNAGHGSRLHTSERCSPARSSVQAASKAVLETEDIVAAHYRRFLQALVALGLCVGCRISTLQHVLTSSSSGLASEKKKAEKAAAKEANTNGQQPGDDDSSAWNDEAALEWDSQWDDEQQAKRARTA